MSSGLLNEDYYKNVQPANHNYDLEETNPHTINFEDALSNLQKIVKEEKEQMLQLEDEQDILKGIQDRSKSFMNMSITQGNNTGGGKSHRFRQVLIEEDKRVSKLKM